MTWDSEENRKISEQRNKKSRIYQIEVELTWNETENKYQNKNLVLWK